MGYPTDRDFEDARERRQPPSGKRKPKSVVQDWMSELPFRMQAVVLCALRGCDGQSREDPHKPIARYLRSCVLNPAFQKEDDRGTFMEGAPSSPGVFLRDIDKYPIHWFVHFLHAAEILGCYHPDEDTRDWWSHFYCHGVQSLHFNPESKAQLDERFGPGSNG